MADFPEPPYPATTLAKGWHFDLDPERIMRSDTWDLAAEIPLCRPALLMMWFVAWQQAPCGSLPADEQVLRAKLQIPADVWPSMRDHLLRGWWQAGDGRLYHNTLIERVKEMMAKRRSDADRQALHRAKQGTESPAKSDATPKESRVTPVGLGAESSTDYRQSSPTSKTVSKASPSHPPKGGKRGKEATGGRFEEFWQAWPKSERKQDRLKCWDHWKRNSLDAEADRILADVRVKRGTKKWQDGFIEAPLVYLRGKRWEDGVEPGDGDNAGALDWRESRKGIEAKAVELGIGPWDEAKASVGQAENYLAYKARVLKAAAAAEVVH